MLDHTHSAHALSWVKDANNHPAYPIQNLPFGIFSYQHQPQIGVAIGDHILDIHACITHNLLNNLDAASLHALRQPTLNAWMALDQTQRTQIRHQLFDLLSSNNPAAQQAQQLLIAQRLCTMHLPSQIGDYTDFYAGIYHAINVGKLFRPDQPLMPNFLHQPIAYHGRSSSIRTSGIAIQRPQGLVGGNNGPVFTPSQRLDFELELAIWVGTGNAQGQPIPIAQAKEHIAGYGLFNDWSARDIQAWEYQPLGPFASKNFASTVSPWVVTEQALVPFRTALMKRDPAVPKNQPYLTDPYDQEQGSFNIQLEVLLSTEKMRTEQMPAHRISLSNTQHLYWTPAQLIAHHTIGGCNLQAGDLLGSGTISSPEPSGFGSLLELTEGGKKAILLPSGEQRYFLEDGDEITLRAYTDATPYRIGFGECSARIQA